MAIVWKDETTHYQGDKEREPRTWAAHAGDLKIVVTRHRDHEPDRWLLRTQWFGDWLLDARDADEAKREAIAWVKRRIDAISSKLAR